MRSRGAWRGHGAGERPAGPGHGASGDRDWQSTRVVKTGADQDEARVPVFIYNAKDAPEISYFTGNYKLAAWLYR